MTSSPFSPRRLFGLLAVSLGISLTLLSCGGYSAAPSEESPVVMPTQGSIIPSPTSQPSIPVTGGGGDDATPLPAIPERRRLTLEFPAKIRAGDSDIVRLTLEMDDLGNVTPTAQFEGNVVTGKVIEIPNLYETHSVVAEARFDIAGLQVSPPDLISQSLAPGQTLNFYWSVRPQQVGIYRGTVWLYLRFVERASGEESQRTVSAQPVEIEAVNVLGLPANLVRMAGGIGSVAGMVIGFPFFEDVLKFLFRRWRGKSKT